MVCKQKGQETVAQAASACGAPRSTGGVLLPSGHAPDAPCAVVVEVEGSGPVVMQAATEADAGRKLFRYVREYWDDEFPGEDMPEEPAEAISAYFDRLEGEDYQVLSSAVAPGHSTDPTADGWALLVYPNAAPLVTLCGSREEAERKLYEQVEEWWDDDVGDEPMPQEPEEAVRLYFEKTGDRVGADILPVGPVKTPRPATTGTSIFGGEGRARPGGVG